MRGSAGAGGVPVSGAGADANVGVGVGGIAMKIRRFCVLLLRLRGCVVERRCF